LILCGLVELFCQEPQGEEDYIRVARLMPSAVRVLSPK
jgi:hypothetical protein